MNKYMNAHQNHGVGSCRVDAQDGHVTIWRLAYAQVSRGGAWRRFVSDVVKPAEADSDWSGLACANEHCQTGDLNSSPVLYHRISSLFMLCSSLEKVKVCRFLQFGCALFA